METQYQEVMASIVECVRFIVELCKATGYRELAGESVGEAIRILRNVVSFLQHLSEDQSVLSQSTDCPNISESLASVAAGANYGGLGTRAGRLRQYKRYIGSGGATVKETPRANRLLREQLLAVIDVLKTRGIPSVS